MVGFFKYILTCVLVLGLSDFNPAFCAGFKEPARISVLIATGMPGGTYYQVGLGMASLWTTKLRDMGIRVSAAVSEGSLENIEAIRIADADLILVEDSLCSMAYKGVGLFKNRPLGELRSITTLWQDALHVLIRSDKMAKGNLEDLEGLVIATELPDSGNKLTTETLFKALKSGKKKVQLRAMSNMAAGEALRRGTVDGMDLIGGIPVALITHLMTEKKPLLSFLEVSDAQLLVAREEGGKHLFRTVIPAGTYPGQDSAIRTVSRMNVLAVTSSLDSQVVYELTKTFYENLEYMTKIHPACRSIALGSALERLNVPLHRGALRYYREKKLKIPEHLIQ